MTIDRGFIAMSNIHPSPIFVADAKGLDFLNSIATQVDTPVDWLGSGDDLLAWLEEADLVPPDVLKILKTTVPCRRTGCGCRAGPLTGRVVPRLCSKAQGQDSEGQCLAAARPAQSGSGAR